MKEKKKALKTRKQKQGLMHGGFDPNDDPFLKKYREGIEQKINSNSQIMLDTYRRVQQNSGMSLALNRIFNDLMLDQLKTINVCRFDSDGKKTDSKCIDVDWYKEQLDASTGFTGFFIGLRNFLGEKWSSFEDSFQMFLDSISKEDMKNVETSIEIKQFTESSESNDTVWFIDFSNGVSFSKENQTKEAHCRIEMLLDDIEALPADPNLGVEMFCNGRIRISEGAAEVRKLFMLFAYQIDKQFQEKQKEQKQ